LCIALLGLLGFGPMTVAPLHAQTAESQSSDREEVADTTVTDDDDEPTGRIKIRIDEHGISIEGSTKNARDTEWIRVTDDRGFKEKGTDIVKLGESVFVDADEMVRGDLVVLAGDAIVEGRVTGNVVVIGGDLRVRSGAEIKGDVFVLGGTIDDDDDVIIRGERIEFNKFFPDVGVLSFLGGDTTLFEILCIVVCLFIGAIMLLLVILFLRDRVLATETHLDASQLKCFGIGLISVLVAFFAVLILMIPLLISIVGIPLALLLLVSCVGVSYIANTVFCYSLGKIAARKFAMETTNPFALAILGLVLLFIPTLISFVLGRINIGMLSPLEITFDIISACIWFFAGTAGFGALVMSRFGSRPVTDSTVTTPPPAPGTILTENV